MFNVIIDNAIGGILLTHQLRVQHFFVDAHKYQKGRSRAPTVLHYSVTIVFGEFNTFE